MKNITFGSLIEKLLYISNQKKSSLAKALGYDISYVNKWIASKNMPSGKRVNDICRGISSFIVHSLDELTSKSLIEYFEMDIESNNREYIEKYIEDILKESYIKTIDESFKSKSNIPKNTHSEEYYNSTSYVKPNLLEKKLTSELNSYANKGEDIHMLMSLNLFDLSIQDKVSLVDMKTVFYEISKKTNIRIDLLMGFNGENKDKIFNAILVINLISEYPTLKFRVYNCGLNSNTSIFAIKDKMIYTSIFSNEGECIFANISKDKKLVAELYYNLEYTLKNKGKYLCDKRTPVEMIEDQIYIQYIMNNDLRCLLGSINEFFMPEDLFMEIAQQVFGDNEKVINELKKINVFLQNATYKSKLKVLIYESELRKYISSGCLHFFNTPVILNFKQRERHIAYMQKLLMESNDVEIRLVDGDFVEEFKNNQNPSLYLSKNLKFTKVHPESGKNKYSIIRDNEFKNICNDLFDKLWNDRKDIVLDNKEEIIERIEKSVSYTRIISENFGDDIQ